MAYIQSLTVDEFADVFSALEIQMNTALSWATQNPQALTLTGQLFVNQMHPVYNDLLASGVEKVVSLYNMFIEHAVNSDLIRGDLKRDVFITC